MVDPSPALPRGVAFGSPFQGCFPSESYTSLKGTLLGTPNREPQEYNRNVMEYKDPGRYIPIIYLLYSWGSRFGVPSKVPLILM